MLEQFPRGRLARPVIGTGFLGAYTTFSTFMVEAVLLIRDGHVGDAVAYLDIQHHSRARGRLDGDRLRPLAPASGAVAPRGRVMEGTVPRSPGRPGKRLTLLMHVHDHVGHASLRHELFKRARQTKVAGATTFEGDQGFGFSGHVHRGHLMTDDRPLALVIVDDPTKIAEFLENIADLLDRVVATVDEIEIVDL